ncbi:MAG TPA: ABC transporter substrate-binding protein [Acetobacteraceae bacterium]|jgi:peptide/nickel transport system substrate-binding protein|nr:ABC transporter substrate-binding protein [Acetobacteraceae bacterium]
MKRRLGAIAGGLLASVLWFGPSWAATTFKWANDGDVGAMDPYTREETVQLSFLGNIYEPLIRRDAQLKLQPALATSWEEINPTTWRFHLRHGVKWQDGSPFTADDVVFSFNRIMSKTSVMRDVMASVKDAKKIDDYTVDFEMKHIDPIFPQEQSNLLIVSKAWMTKHGAVDPVIIGGTADNYAVHNAMGTGPYRLVSREPDHRTVVEKNPTWWDKNPSNADRVEFDVINNASTRVAALLSGEEDMIYSVPVQDMPRIAHAPGLKLIEHPELRTIFLGMDQIDPELKDSNVKGKNPLKDVRVRRAFALAIDENLIAKVIMRGLAHPSWEMWGPGVNGYNPKLDVRPTANPAESKKLLAEAGYPNGFSLGMDCPDDRYVMDVQICTAVVSMLAKVGVKVALNAQTKTKFFAKITAPRFDTDFYLLGWTPATYDAENTLFALLGSRNGVRGNVNAGGYSNPELDKLIAEIGSENDQAKRIDEINQSIKLIQDQVASIPLHQQVIVWATKKNVSVVQTADNNFQFRFIKMGQ